MITVGCVATLLFLGGWTSPFGDTIDRPANIFVHALLPIFWFVAKVFCFLFLYVWVRGTLPRFRYDQLMSFGWKYLMPLAILNIVATSLWPRLPPAVLNRGTQADGETSAQKQNTTILDRRFGGTKRFQPF